MYKVLLVEDEAIIRKSLALSIPWHTYDCVIVGETCNGQEGARLIEELRPDIVFADINMPIMNGLEMIEKTYALYEHATIILSGYSSFEYAQQAIKYGVMGYLLKPVNTQELIEVVNNAKKELSKRQQYLQTQHDPDHWQSVSLLEHLPERTEDVVQKTLDYLHQHYQEKIVMLDVVQELNYSDTYLRKKFKESLGVSLNDYLNKYRVQKSLAMIRNGEDTLQNIGWRCGIGEYKYFSIVFKKYLGCSPKEYASLVRTNGATSPV